jgi:ketosteroid isomerase-like protein
LHLSLLIWIELFDPNKNNSYYFYYIKNGGRMVSDTDRMEVEKCIDDAIGWAESKDIERLFSIMAQDENFFIFHPDSRSTIQGFAAFRELGERSWMKDAFKATDHAIRDLHLNFSRSGDVAWYSCMLDDHAEWNGQSCGWDNCRWTGTLEKREDHWVIVQMHFSFAKDN